MKESDPIELTPDEEGGETDETKSNSVPEALHTVTALSGMYQDWFLDYASYVILERAVPHISDGLKPVQRRILYSMKRMDDGRFNKVANIIGHTMQFHPHGDASIGDALVQLGQKDLLVEAQGNWGNILTGDGAAAPRYIEARLSKLALEVAFNSKTTEWISSYDGRNKEPASLPVKFPLLLAMGVEGIAVGLASKILPHNFNELVDASINYLQGKPFVIYPDFPTAGMIDVSRYNDGVRGGAVKVRARIEKADKKGLVITEIPFGRTTSSLIESIVKASDRGKIKIKKIDDNTAGGVEIVIQLQSGISPDKTIDALYAFTDCELSISPNACVITDDNKPAFLGVSDILRHSANQTVKLLTRELEIRQAELEEEWHFSSLEKIFIEKRIYRDIEESETWEAVISAIDKGLKPYRKLFRRDITRDDIIKLTEIKIKRISKYDSSRADEHIRGIEAGLEDVIKSLASIIPYTINYYKQIKKRFGKHIERRTEIRSFETIEATKVVAANAKLYVNHLEGFIGTGLKKDEYVCDCSDIDDIIVIKKDGSYLITRVLEKQFVGKDIMYIQVFLRNDTRTIYNVVYQDGRAGSYYVKRSALTGLTRDKDYSLGKGTPGTRVLYLSVNPNGEAEVIRVYHKPKARLKKLTFEFDFGEMAIKGRGSVGNILTRNPVHKINLKEKGLSTLGGRKMWFDDSVMRLNADGRGRFLGEFVSGDMLLAVTRGGWYRTSGTDLSLHFEDDLLLLEKFRESKIFSAVYWDKEQEFYYVKRFAFEENERLQCFISDSEGSKLISLTEVEYPRLELSFGGRSEGRRSEIIEVAGFIGVKSFRAKGKRLSNYSVTDIRELEPVVKSEAAPSLPDDDDGDEPGQASRGSLPEDPSQMTLDL